MELHLHYQSQTNPRTTRGIAIITMKRIYLHLITKEKQKTDTKSQTHTPNIFCVRERLKDNEAVKRRRER